MRWRERRQRTEVCRVSTLKCLNGQRHALSRQSTNSAAPNFQPSCPSGILHVFLSPGRPSLYSPFPRELLVCKPHSTPATPTPANKKNPRASLTFRPPTFPGWASTRSQGPLPAPLPEKYLVPLEANTPAAPSPIASPDSRPYPGTQATRSAVSSRPLPSK